MCIRDSGGILSTIADNACAFAAFSLMKDTFQPLTIEFKINFLTQQDYDYLIAKGIVLRAGKSITHTKSEIYSVLKKKETLISFSTATIKSTKIIKELWNFSLIYILLCHKNILIIVTLYLTLIG